MTLKVNKSQLAGVDFAAVVEEHRQALLAHRFTVGEPAPVAHSMIEGAVRRVPIAGSADDFVADFEVVDDTPPPPSIEERRNDLLVLVRTAEIAAARAVIGNGKLRLLSLDARTAMLKPVDERTPADIATLKTLNDVTAKREAIERHAATLEAEIEDLPDDAIAGYKFEAFPA